MVGVAAQWRWFDPLLLIHGAFGSEVDGASGGWSTAAQRFSPLASLGGRGALGDWQGCLQVLLLPGVVTVTWPRFEKWHGSCGVAGSCRWPPSVLLRPAGPRTYQKGPLFRPQRQWSMLMGVGWSWMPWRWLWWWEHEARGRSSCSGAARWPWPCGRRGGRGVTIGGGGAVFVPMPRAMSVGRGENLFCLWAGRRWRCSFPS